MSITQQRPQPGTDAFWADRRRAFAQIAEIEAAIRDRDAAPQFYAGRYGIEGEAVDIQDHLGPWDRVAELQEAAARNPTVREILGAQNRLQLLTA